MGRKEAQEGRRDEESEKMKKLLKKMKNEKVAKGRIIGLAGPCFYQLVSIFNQVLYIKHFLRIPFLEQISKHSVSIIKIYQVKQTE